MSKKIQVNEQIITLRQIRIIKRNLLNKAFISLITHLWRIDLYKKICKPVGFNYFSIEAHKKCEELGERKWLDRPIDTSMEGFDHFMIKSQIIAKNMCLLSYEPPLDDDEERLIHLWTMFQLYKNSPIVWPPEKDELCLDFSFAKLLSSVQRYIAHLTARAEREETRKIIQIEKNRERAAEKAKPIIEAFYDLKFQNGVSLHHIATEIKKKRNESLDTIKRVLRKDENIWKQFKEKEVKGTRCFIKQT